MINIFLKTVWQNVCLSILQFSDALYRHCVRLLYHSKIVGVLSLIWIITFATSCGFYFSIFSIDTNSIKNGFYTIDVGQGDSLLYITKEGQTFLIDTGRPGDNIVQKLENILGGYRKKIDVILLTHPDSDHVGEIKNILASFNVGLILYSPIYDVRPDSKKAIDDIKNEIKNKNGHENGHGQRERQSLALPVFAGENILFSKDESAYFLSPAFSGMVNFANKKEMADDNYFSVVSMIKNKDVIFAMADAPQKIEKVLASSVYSDESASSSDLDFDIFDQLSDIIGEKFNRNQFEKMILKVGHHGSKTSSATDFIKKLSPTDAILSYGENNRYGHPTQETLSILSSIPNIKIHKTISGTVYFRE